MPARKGIVKSGNAGNSSKPAKAAQEGPKPPEEKPLFPPGFKYPLSLLHERAQKNGWDKPSVETRKQGDGYSFTVTISRMNKKNERESVRLEPHPPYIRLTVIEARHWGATYALYRFCNGIQLNRVLPPGPREYWNELTAEHKNAPEHQRWMYEADPFAARKAVDERQQRAAGRREESSGDAGGGAGSTSSEFANAPEVKMASSLRDLVEGAIKKAIVLYPEVQDTNAAVLDADRTPELLKNLQHLGFTLEQARSAITALSSPSPIANMLLSTMDPLQASVEYLVLHVPECDLPKRFLPDLNSSNPFVSSIHSGTTDIRKRWLRDKAIKQWGWPARIVDEALKDQILVEDWKLLLKHLNKRLVGDDPLDTILLEADEVDRVPLDEEELEALGARIVDESLVEIPMPVAPFHLHMIVYPDHQLPIHNDLPAMFISSTSTASYIRLHLVAKLIKAFRDSTLVEEGESIIMAAMRVIEEEWAHIQDHGPPNISLVMQHLLPLRKGPEDQVSVDFKEDSSSNESFQRDRYKRRKKDDRSDVRIKDDFKVLQQQETYSNILAKRSLLPAFAMQDTFLRMLEKNQVVVVVGETGCGKTTQLPQFILDSLVTSLRGSTASIIVTQPRRLSVLGVAAHVSSERLEDGSVGYAIRGESKQDERTKLLFCTTGVLLRRLGSGDKLTEVTHVIVDEVHERSIDSDFLLLELKELMERHNKLKVVLMSATINHELFVQYFNGAPLLAIPGFTYPVKDIYVEEIIPRISYRPSGNSKGARKVSQKEKQDVKEKLMDMGLNAEDAAAVEILNRSDGVDYEFLTAVVKHIVATSDRPAGILIFLPGVQEIRICLESLRTISNTKAFPLHANLSSDEQRAVFAPTQGWKIIAATNVAETSITINDVVYVVDTGRVKETHYDPESGLTKLNEQWVTRAASRQRRGRAGRTQPGFCYKLYTRSQEKIMQPFPIPEIKRVALESVSLTVKVVHHDVKSFLSKAIDPPVITAIDHALTSLTEMGAITKEGEVTPLGQYLSMIPVDLRIGKMLVLGTVFRCLGPILTVAACMSSKPLFIAPIEEREQANSARARFADANSDILTDARAYDECTRLRSEGNSKVQAFCRENYISTSTLRDINSLRQEFLSALSSVNLVPFGSIPSAQELNMNSNNVGLVKGVILGGLWPRVARVVLPHGAVKFDRVQAGTVQRANEAKQFKLFDIRAGEGGRVFLHPSSILFHSAEWKVPFVAYFQKQMTSKLFLRGVTEVPFYALLLFGGPVTVNHISGGVIIGDKDAYVKLKAWPRIGILVNQLRRLLDIQLKRAIEQGETLMSAGKNPVVEGVLGLLANDGLSGGDF